MTGIIAISRSVLPFGKDSFPAHFQVQMELAGCLLFQTPHAGESSNLRHESYFDLSFASLFG
jgi:hypothetical protein